MLNDLAPNTQKTRKMKFASDSQYFMKRLSKIYTCLLNPPTRDKKSVKSQSL